MLRLVAVPFIRVLQNTMLQQDNARQLITGIVLTFLNTRSARLLAWTVFSQDLASIENAWSMISEQQSHHYVSVTIVGELCQFIEAAWA